MVTGERLGIVAAYTQSKGQVCSLAYELATT